MFEILTLTQTHKLAKKSRSSFMVRVLEEGVQPGCAGGHGAISPADIDLFHLPTRRSRRLSCCGRADGELLAAELAAAQGAHAAMGRRPTRDLMAGWTVEDFLSRRWPRPACRSAMIPFRRYFNSFAQAGSSESSSVSFPFSSVGDPNWPVSCLTLSLSTRIRQTISMQRAVAKCELPTVLQENQLQMHGRIDSADDFPDRQTINSSGRVGYAAGRTVDEPAYCLSIRSYLKLLRFFLILLAGTPVATIRVTM